MKVWVWWPGSLKGCRWMKGCRIAVGMIPRRFGTCTNLFGHSFGHMLDNLHGDFVADFFRNWSTYFFRNFSWNINGILDTNGFGKVFTSFSWYEDGKILALFLGNFFAFGTRHLFLDLYWNLKIRKRTKKNYSAGIFTCFLGIVSLNWYLVVVHKKYCNSVFGYVCNCTWKQWWLR